MKHHAYPLNVFNLCYFYQNRPCILYFKINQLIIINLSNSANPSLPSFQLRPHNRHRRRLHLDDAVPVGAVSALVHPNPGLWPAAPVLDAEPAGAVAGRLPPAHLVRPVQPDPAAPPAGTGADQLSGRVPGAVRLPAGALAALFADRIMIRLLLRVGPLPPQATVVSTPPLPTRGREQSKANLYREKSKHLPEACLLKAVLQVITNKLTN